MAELYTCYSPSGEKFELPRANFLDCTQHYGFTTVAPGEVPATKDSDNGYEPGLQSEGNAEAESSEVESTGQADEDASEVSHDEAEEGEVVYDFDQMEKEDLKEFIRSNFPDAAFDGRASREALVALAAELTGQAVEAE